MVSPRSWTRSRSRTRSRTRSRSPIEVQKTRSARTRSRSASKDNLEHGKNHSHLEEFERYDYGSSRENPAKSKCIGVFGLSQYTTERSLEKEFRRYGLLEKCEMVVDGYSGRSRGFAFVYFTSIDDACAAREALNGIELDGRKIRVDFSISKSGHRRTGVRMLRGREEGYGRHSPLRRYTDMNEQYERRGRWNDFEERRTYPMYHRCSCHSGRGYRRSYY